MGLQYWLEHRLRCVRVRPFNHIGPRQSPRFVTAGFARQVAEAEAGLLRPAVIRVGNLAPHRDFTDVRDIVRGYYLALTRGRPGEVYNLGSGKPVTIQSVLDFYLGRAQCPVEATEAPDLVRPTDIPLVACDARKLRDETGWQPEIPLEQTLDDVLSYWRAHVAGQTP
jgi:GDP-4-dehydro-6-deoxy-D-mannose reductase